MIDKSQRPHILSQDKLQARRLLKPGSAWFAAAAPPAAASAAAAVASATAAAAATVLEPPPPPLLTFVFKPQFPF